MTIKKVTTKNGGTVTVEIIHRVQDKIAYLDGLNLKIGREVINRTTITLRNAAAEIVATDYELHGVDPRFDAKAIKDGAVARIDHLYLRQEMYNLISDLLNYVENETSKSDEQIAIEGAETKSERNYLAWY